MAENTIELTDENISEYLKTEITLIVDFWAPWCDPCKTLTPVIEQLADELDGVVAFGMINVDTDLSTALDYGVRTIPTLIKFVNGNEVSKFIGLHSKEEIIEFINSGI